MTEAEAFLKRMHEVEHTVALGDAAVEAAVLAERRRCAALARAHNDPHEVDPDAPEQIARAIEEGRQP